MALDRDPSSLFEPVDPAILEQTRAFNGGVERLLATQPSVHTIPVEVTRRVRRKGGGIFPPPVYLPEARDLQIPGRAGTIKVRVIGPPKGERVVGAHLYFHGGGWMLGASDLEDPALAAQAAATGLAMVSVEYRLSPEHPFPAAVDDAEDAARWILAEGSKALDVPPCFTIGGESAGAHLTALALLRLRDSASLAASTGFRAVDLVYGAYDMSLTPSTLQWGDRNLVLSGPIMRFFGDAFLKDIPMAERRAPHISPLYADLRGLPPALFTVGSVDPLLDDSLFMAQRWRAAGNEAELRVWPEGIHGFVAFDLELGRLARAREVAFLQRWTRA